MATAADGTHPTGMHSYPIVKNSAYFALFMTSDNNAVLSEGMIYSVLNLKENGANLNQNFLNCISFSRKLSNTHEK